MHCEKFESRLQDLLDARLRPECDEELQAHAAACTDCRETLLIQEQLFAGLEIWEAPETSDSFATSVVTATLAERPVVAPKSKSGNILWLAITAAVAASLMLAASPIVRWVLSPAQQPVVAEQPAPVTPAHPPVEVAVAVMPEVPDAELTVPGPTHAISFTPQQLAAGGEEVLRNLQQLPEVPVDQSVERIPGLRPIANTFGLAIDVVRRALPGGKETPASPDQKSLRPTKPQAEWIGLHSGDVYA